MRLKPGMGVAEARAIHPGIEVLDADPQADARLLEALADWCDRYTPLVGIDGQDGLFLDITGCAHLFGGERAMLDDILARFFHQGFMVRAGLAATPGAAWAVARFEERPIILERGEEAAALAAMPLRALRIDETACVGLQSVGLRTVGMVVGLPRAPLVRRFGRRLALRLDQALGDVEEPISPRLPVPPLSAERMLSEPISLTDDIEAMVSLLARQLRRDLERRGDGADHLLLSLFRVDGWVGRLAVRTSRPLREPTLVRALFHEKLTALETDMEAGYGFDLIRLSVLSAVPLVEPQADLDGETGEAEGELGMFADRVRARFGEEAIRRPRLLESHVPERAAVLTRLSLLEDDGGRRSGRRAPIRHAAKDGKESTATEAAPALADAKAKACWENDRPLRLFPAPEDVEVRMADAPEGPPLHFRWRRVDYRVTRAEGPERIDREWWRDPLEAAARDYFRVEDEGGRRFWLYRQGSYCAGEGPPRWYLHGLFA